ncbi:hypothetical protein [Polaromonas sp.]|nr:hypothetical protein [Polaromonas sp.]
MDHLTTPFYGEASKQVHDKFVIGHGTLQAVVRLLQSLAADSIPLAH